MFASDGNNVIKYIIVTSEALLNKISFTISIKPEFIVLRSIQNKIKNQLMAKNKRDVFIKYHWNKTDTGGSNDLGLHVVKPSGNKRCLQIEITLILTVCCSSQRVFCLRSVHSGWTDPQFDHKAATSTTGTVPTPAPSDGGRHTSECRAYCQVSLSSMCQRSHQSRSKLPAQQMHWMGACEMLNAAQYRRNKDWTWAPCSASKTQQSIPPRPSVTISNPCSICRRN